MEVLASNFEAALMHFEEHLEGAMYAAVDMELTGTTIDNMPDSFEDYAAERFAKLCQVAETHAPIQIGITLVRHENNCFECASYNFYALPWVGPELLGHDPSFLCKRSSLQFNADSGHIDFNKWLKHSVPYMSCEDEARYLGSSCSSADVDLPRKVGLLRVWKLLCEARLPLVTHGPLDLFFLLACFERRELPRDPKEMSRLVLQRFHCVFDTAYLHGSIGGFQRLGLLKFLEDARARHADLSALQEALPCSFRLESETAARYGEGSNDLAHEAGFDSLCTAQLYAYLLNVSPTIVEESANRLFLFRSVECLDLRRAADVGEAGSRIAELSGDSLVVARVRQPRDPTVPKVMSDTGLLYKWIDACHILVGMGAPGSEKAAKATWLSSSIPGAQWLSFEQWRAEARSHTFRRGTKAKWRGNSRRCIDAWRAPDGLALPEHVGPVPGSNKQACLDVGARYRGVIKTFNSSTGFGFISCPETYDTFKRDVFVHGSQIAAFGVGQEVLFAVCTNARGQPQAKDLRAAEGDTAETDVDEGRTTVEASSDCASSDLDSNSWTGSDGQHVSPTMAWLMPPPSPLRGA